MDNINKQAQHLSKTIDDFRNFFKGDTNKVSEFEIKNTLENVRNLTKDTFSSNFIEYNDSIEECKLKGNENILIQALINIYNNAKDALSANGLDKKLFYLEAKKVDNNLLITIKDNGNGIPKNIIGKVFEPYFTTKHESVGTGIGLYMTNQIITKHFKGSIVATNKKYFIDDIEYTGAQFTIKIPVVL
jgi:signal transduction histidine kinase